MTYRAASSHGLGDDETRGHRVRGEGDGRWRGRFRRERRGYGVYPVDLAYAMVACEYHVLHTHTHTQEVHTNRDEEMTYQIKPNQTKTKQCDHTTTKTNEIGGQREPRSKEKEVVVLDTTYERLFHFRRGSPLIALAISLSHFHHVLLNARISFSRAYISSPSEPLLYTQSSRGSLVLPCTFVLSGFAHLHNVSEKPPSSLSRSSLVPLDPINDTAQPTRSTTLLYRPHQHHTLLFRALHLPYLPYLPRLLRLPSPNRSPFVDAQKPTLSQNPTQRRM